MRIPHTLRSVAVLAIGLLAAPPRVAATEATPPLDQGRFVISVHGKTLGAEDFTYRVLGDSLCLGTELHILRNPDGKPDSVSKVAFMAVGIRDHALHVYESNETFREVLYVVGVTCRDTTYTIHREIDGQGSADRKVMPPGRVFVLDPMLYSLMNLISLSLHDQGFTSRPITMLVVAPRDSLVEGIVTRVGSGPFAHGQRTVQAQHWTLSQGGVVFDMWVDSRGRLLRIENTPTGLRVDRYAAKVKPRPVAKPGG